MSAPAMKLRPAPISSIAFTAGSAFPLSTAATMPSGTPGDSALTGGLSTVMTPMSPSFSKRTSSPSAIFHSYLFPPRRHGGHGKEQHFRAHRKGRDREG